MAKDSKNYLRRLLKMVAKEDLERCDGCQNNVGNIVLRLLTCTGMVLMTIGGINVVSLQVNL
jgi:hypothetical protein